MFQEASAFLVVVGVESDVSKLKEELKKYMQEDMMDLKKPSALMICASESEEEFRLSPVNLASGLSPQFSPWYISQVVVDSLEGIYPTLSWMRKVLLQSS